MAGTLHYQKVEDFPFMTFIMKVNVRVAGWQKVVSAALSNIHGVRHFRMEEDGKIEVSGTVNPKQLLKMLGSQGRRKIEMISWQFGVCHDNLYLPEKNPEPEHQQYGGRNNYGYYGDEGYYYGGIPYYVDNYRHLHCNGGYEDLPPLKCPFQALEAPPAAACRKGMVPCDQGGPTEPPPPVNKNPPQSGQRPQQCCSVM